MVTYQKWMLRLAMFAANIATVKARGPLVFFYILSFRPWILEHSSWEGNYIIYYMCRLFGLIFKIKQSNII